MSRFRHHHLSPSLESVRVVICYKNFAANKGVSHTGLGLSAHQTATTLKDHGIHSEVWACVTPDDIEKRLDHEQEKAHKHGLFPVSHVIISAPWIPTFKLATFVNKHHDVSWGVNCHSNVGFLAADANGIKLLREYVDLQNSTNNFNVMGNSKKFVTWASIAWGSKIAFMPNLPNVKNMKHVGHRTPWHPGQPIKVGIYGAQRPLKGSINSVAAAVELAQLTKSDVKISMSSGRAEGGGQFVQGAIEQMVAGLRNVSIEYTGWLNWANFKKVVEQQNICMQMSYTESCNLVTFDAITSGVSSVVSEAIDWVPKEWQAHFDDANDIAKKALHLLHDVQAVNDGQNAARKYVDDGLKEWKRYLLNERHDYLF